MLHDEAMAVGKVCLFYIILDIYGISFFFYLILKPNPT